MAIQSVQIDPAGGGGGGVSQGEFDAHTHDYRRIDTIGNDSNTGYTSPNRATLVDDGEVNPSGESRIRSIGIAASTQQTGVPT